MKNNKTDIEATSPTKSIEEVKKMLSHCRTGSDPNTILREADKVLAGTKSGEIRPTSLDGSVFKSLTLFEFDNGSLLTLSVPEQYKTFGIDLMRNLQVEYNCQTSSEKATSELAAVSYIRTLEIQRKINALLSQSSISELGIKYLAVLSKELDRANRHYLEAILALKSQKQPQLDVSIKTQMAILGQNQLIQANSFPNDS